MARYEAAFYDSLARYDEPDSLTATKKGRHMASNPTPDLQADLLALAEQMADGCDTYQAAIGIVQNTNTVIRAAITALRTTETDYALAKDARQVALDAHQAQDDLAYDFIAAAKRVLTQFLGTQWSTAWEPTGFPDQSTAIPKSREKRLNLLASLRNYFTAVPAHEVAPLGVTAALANTRFTAWSDAQDAFDQKEVDQETKKQLRNTAEMTLRKRVRGLISELETLLADNDPRWHAFGLSMPSDPDTPEPVELVTLTPNMAGKVVATWPRATRATRYRLFKQVVGVDAEFIHVDTVHDREFMFEGLPSGQTLNVYVIAANDAGEAPPSPTAQMVIP